MAMRWLERMMRVVRNVKFVSNVTLLELLHD
jgi:hypothetical protein